MQGGPEIIHNPLLATPRAKKRILFVEDNELLLRMYTGMLGDEKERWDVSTADSAEQALELMSREAFDVVVSDMRMPGMSGAEFLNQVRVRHPGSSRIILSGLTDQEEVARCLDSTHQFLAKPFNVKTLKATLARIGALDVYLRNEKLKALVGQFNTLPSFPSLYLEIMKEMSSEVPMVERVAEIIAKDPGMTAKLLQIVNSAAMGLSRKVTSPFEAVQFLGFGTVRSLVLSAHIFACFEHTQLKRLPVAQLWSHGMKTAQIASLILQLEQAEPAEVEDAYIAGMLHDVGKLLLADSLADKFEEALALAEERRIHLREAELEIFGATHAGAAAYLLGLWGLPASIAEAIAFHHTPAASDTRVLSPLTAVHVANVLEHELSGESVVGKPAELDVNYLAAICMENRIETWRAATAKAWAEAKSKA